MADSTTATTDERTIPDRVIDPKFIESPERPAIKITEVRIKFSDFE